MCCVISCLKKITIEERRSGDTNTICTHETGVTQYNGFTRMDDERARAPSAARPTRNKTTIMTTTMTSTTTMTTTTTTRRGYADKRGRTKRVSTSRAECVT